MFSDMNFSEIGMLKSNMQGMAFYRTETCSAKIGLVKKKKKKKSNTLDPNLALLLFIIILQFHSVNC